MVRKAVFLDRNQIRDLLVRVLIEIQSESGRPVPEIGDDTKPLSDLPGFDSVNAEEAILLFGEYISCETGLNVGIFAVGGEDASLGQVVNQITAHFASKRR